jgi:hypothetical protein
MSEFPMLRFVAAPEPAAAVRLDLQAAPGYVAVDGFTIGAPTLEGEPDGVGVEYGFRTLGLTQVVKGTKAQALAMMSTLAKELLRRENWLLFQLSASSLPVWFKTYRTAPGEVSLEMVYDDDTRQDVWQISVTLDADPFAYGARETLPAVTVNNDPAAASNPMLTVLPAIKGDAPAPLRVVMSPSADMWGHRIMLSTVRRSQVSPHRWDVGTDDLFTAGTDTSAPVADAAFSGGSYRAVTFSTNTGLVARLSSGETLPPPPGRYKVMLRIARTDGTGAFAMRLTRWDVTGGDEVVGPLATFTPHADVARSWVDLGEQEFPIGGAVEGYEPRNAGIRLDAQRLSGAGELWFDVFMLVPVDGDTTITSFVYGPKPFVTGSVQVDAHWDADTERVTLHDPASMTQINTLSSTQGAFLTVDPSTPNSLYVLLQTRTAGSSIQKVNDGIGQSSTLELSYHPRWLWLGDS